MHNTLRVSPKVTLMRPNFVHRILSMGFLWFQIVTNVWNKHENQRNHMILFDFIYWLIFNRFVISPDFIVVFCFRTPAIHRDIHRYCGKPFFFHRSIGIKSEMSLRQQSLLDSFAQWQFALSHIPVTDSSQLLNQNSSPKLLKWWEIIRRTKKEQNE